MGEADPLVLEDEQPPGCGVLDRGERDHLVAIRCGEVFGGRTRKGGGEQQDAPHLVRESHQPFPEQVGEARRHARRRASELEREVGVPARHLVDAREQRSRELDAQPLVDEAVHRPRTQWSQWEPAHPRPGQEAIAWPVCPGADARRGQKRDRLRTQSPQRRVEHRRGGRIEPLQVVQREHNRLLARQGAEDVDECEADRPRFRRRAVRVGEQQRNLQRTPARRCELVCDVSEDRADQVRQPGEREPGFRLDTAMGQNPRAALPGVLDARLPQERLADPRLAGDNERGRPRRRGVQERVQLAELLVTTDDLARGHGPRATISCRGNHGQCAVPEPSCTAPSAAFAARSAAVRVRECSAMNSLGRLARLVVRALGVRRLHEVGARAVELAGRRRCSARACSSAPRR